MLLSFSATIRTSRDLSRRADSVEMQRRKLAQLLDKLCYFTVLFGLRVHYDSESEVLEQFVANHLVNAFLLRCVCHVNEFHHAAVQALLLLTCLDLRAWTPMRIKALTKRLRFAHRNDAECLRVFRLEL